MKIDIEKLNRKIPYPELSEDFFKQIQTNVISQTIGKEPVILKNETKVFSLNIKWMAAAAVVLIAGITAFFGLNDNQNVDSMAKQDAIVDSVFEINKPNLPNAADLVAVNNLSTQTPAEVSKPKQLKVQSNIAYSDSENNDSVEKNITDRQDYVVETKNTSKLDVEKVLAAFTPDQLKDIDRNSEQDVYLDLYN